MFLTVVNNNPQNGGLLLGGKGDASKWGCVFVGALPKRLHHLGVAHARDLQLPIRLLATFGVRATKGTAL